MGLGRIAVSMSTLGVVSPRNKEQRDRKVAKQTRNATRLTAAASVANVKYTRELAHRSRPEPEPRRAPAGWFPDPSGRTELRWWDGQAWTEHTRGSLPASAWNAQQSLS